MNAKKITLASILLTSFSVSLAMKEAASGVAAGAGSASGTTVTATTTPGEAAAGAISASPSASEVVVDPMTQSVIGRALSKAPTDALLKQAGSNVKGSLAASGRNLLSWRGAAAGGIVVTGSVLYALLDNPKVREALEKVGISNLEATVAVPLFTALLTLATVGYQAPKNYAKTFAVAWAAAKLLASTHVRWGLNHIPFIGNKIVTDQEVAQIEKGEVTSDEQGALVAKLLLGITVFTEFWMQIVKAPYVGKYFTA